MTVRELLSFLHKHRKMLAAELQKDVTTRAKLIALIDDALAFGAEAQVGHEFLTFCGAYPLIDALADRSRLGFVPLKSPPRMEDNLMNQADELKSTLLYGADREPDSTPQLSTPEQTSEQS